MTISAAHADSFYEEALVHGEVWAVRDENGYPAPESDGDRAMPFWSTQSRAQRVIETVETYRGLEVVPVSLEDWRSKWLPGLKRDGLRVGLNWAGERATGYDLDPDDVERNLSIRPDV